MKRAGLVLAILLAGCGGGRGGDGGALLADGSKRDFDVQACASELGAFLEALQELDSRLDVGLNIGEYSDYLGDAKVAYDRIDILSLEEGCIEKVGVPLEDAYNEYASALRAWDRCIKRFECDLDDVEPELQEHWAAASAKIEKAAAALET